MTVVIDTNVVPGMFRLRHPHAPLLDAWFDGAFLWAVSTEILLEYSEIVGTMSGAARAQAILDRMDEIDALESNLLRVKSRVSLPADRRRSGRRQIRRLRRRVRGGLPHH